MLPRPRARLVAVMTTAMVGSLAAQDQQPPLFRSNVHTVAVYATVQDRDGRLVPGLAKDDFQILDNGRPTAITTFASEVPITVVLMLDMSDSMRMEYFRVRIAAEKLVEILRPHDRMRIGTFGHTVALSPFLTGDKAILNRVLREEIWISHFTALWAAMKAAMDSVELETGRRVVLALTDGLDYCALGVAEASWRQVVPRPSIDLQSNRPDPWQYFPKTGCANSDLVKKEALTKEFLIYAIGMQPEGLSRPMVDLTEETGGAHFELKKNADLAATFERVAAELHSQYALGFSPLTLDGTTHALDVKLRRPGLSIRARKSYVAVPR